MQFKFETISDLKLICCVMVHLKQILKEEKIRRELGKAKEQKKHESNE